MKKNPRKRLLPRGGPNRLSPAETARLAAGRPGDARKILANIQLPDDHDGVDLFFVVGRPKDGPLVTSCGGPATPEFKPSWDSACEYAWVEIKGWCGDHGRDVKKDSELKQRLEGVYGIRLDRDLAFDASARRSK